MIADFVLQHWYCFTLPPGSSIAGRGRIQLELALCSCQQGRCGTVYARYPALDLLFTGAFTARCQHLGRYSCHALKNPCTTEKLSV